MQAKQHIAEAVTETAAVPLEERLFQLKNVGFFRHSQLRTFIPHGGFPSLCDLGPHESTLGRTAGVPGAIERLNLTGE